MHLTGAHVFTDGQPFTLTASISPLTVRRIPRYETVAPSLVRVERFVAVSTSGVAVDRQWTVEILQRNFISVPLDPRTRTGDEFARSSSRSRSRSARAERVAESLVDASLHIRHGTEGVSCALKEHFVLLFREYYSRSGMFFASRDNRVPRFPPRLCALPLPPMIYAPLSAVILIIIPGLFVYRAP